SRWAMTSASSWASILGSYGTVPRGTARGAAAYDESDASPTNRLVRRDGRRPALGLWRRERDGDPVGREFAFRRAGDVGRRDRNPIRSHIPRGIGTCRLAPSGLAPPYAAIGMR